MQDDGGDIRVTDGSNNQLPADFIEYDPDTRLLAVKFSPDDSGTQTLRIWAGSLSVETFPGDADPFGAHAAYSPKVVAFYPFGGGTDRTSNGYDLTATGSPTVGNAAGPIDGSRATTLSGSQYFTRASSGPTATPLTALAVAKPVNNTAPMHLLGVYDSNSGGSTYNLLALTLRGDITNDPVHAQTFQAGNPAAGHKDGFAANVWNHAAGAWGAGATSRRAFLNGVLGTHDGSNRTPTGIDLISLGARVRTDGLRDLFFAGDVAFVTLYDDDMGDVWIAYHHKMLDAADPDQSDFYTFAGWMGAGGVPAGDDAHVVNGEVDLGLVPNSAGAATANTAILNHYFANAVTNYKPLFLPGKRYYIDDEIFVPPLNGAMVLLGAGGLTMAYAQNVANPIRLAANTILTWVGDTRQQDPTKAMFRVEGAMCKMQGISLEGAKVPTGGIGGYPVADDRVAYGIVIQHFNKNQDHSGKSMYRDLAFRFMNTAIYIHYADEEAETHADENHFSNLYFDAVANPFLIDNFQSIANYFEHIIIYANVEAGHFTATNPFDIRRGGQIVINHMTVNAAGGTVFRIGDAPAAPHANEPWFRRGSGTLSVRDLYVDSATVSQGHTFDRPFRLIEMFSPTVAANIDIQGTLAFNTTYVQLERPAVNPRQVLVTLNTSPPATFYLWARGAYVPETLDINDSDIEGVSPDLSTRVLVVNVDITGGHNTVADLLNVLTGSGNNSANNAITKTLYRAELLSGGTATIFAGSTAITSVEIIELDEPLIVTQGTDSLLQLNLRSLDAVNAAKYPRLALQPLFSQSAYSGVHSVPTFMQPDYMPNYGPSQAILDARAASLIWLESRNATDLTITSGAVSAWNDLSGNGNHVGQGASGNRPKYHYNLINHRAAVHFDNPTVVDDHLENTGSADFNELEDFTIYIVYLPNNLTNAQTLVSNSRFPTDLSWRLEVNTSGKVELHCSDGMTDSVTTSDAALLLNSPNLIIASRDATAGAGTMRINGFLERYSGKVTGALATPTADFLVSGVRHASLGTIIRQIRGAVAALVIQETPDVDEDIVDYLRAVYGVN